MTAIPHQLNSNLAPLAIGLLELVFPAITGCSGAERATTDGFAYEPLASVDASLAVDSEMAPDDDQLCSVDIARAHYVFARALLGTPSVFLAGSYLQYVYGSQPSVSDGLQTIGLTFGPDEVFEGAKTENLAKPSCWVEAEIQNEFRRKELPSLVQASALLQSPNDYPPVPSEDQLCQIVMGRTLARDIWFGILPTGFMRRLRMGPDHSVINFRYGDRESHRVVSLYFYFSAADGTEGNDLLFPLEKIIAYNMSTLPTCW